MRGYLLEMFSVSLILTILIELSVANLCARMNAWTGLLVVLINVLTNPPAVLLCWLGRMYLPGEFNIIVQLWVEVTVVFAEAWVYRSFAKEPRWGIRRPFALSVTANLCSWLCGVVFLAAGNA